MKKETCSLISIKNFDKQIQKADAIQIKFKYKSRRANLPQIERLRQRLHDEQQWNILDIIDVEQTFPVMKYATDKEILDEIICAVRLGILVLDDSQLLFKQKGIIFHYKGYGKKVLHTYVDERHGE